MATSQAPAVLEIRQLSKRYGDTVALNGLNLTVRGGLITGVAGPNGAGKSTLVKVLAGEVRPDSGEVLLDRISWAPVVGRASVAVVHQEPLLFPNLTVAENLLVGREDESLARPKVTERDWEMLEHLVLRPYALKVVGECSLAVRQRVELARALLHDALVFLFDEPNSALTTEESRELFELLHGLADAGRVVLLVSHRLAELAEHCQRVIVIRDGSLSRDLEGSEISETAIARELVTVDLSRVPHAPGPSGPVQEVILEHIGWTHAKGLFSNVDVTIKSREVLAVVGVEGSGARELVRSLVGIEPVLSNSHIAATNYSVQYVPPDRAEGLFANLSVTENLASRLGRLEITNRIGMLSYRRMIEMAVRAISSFAIKTASPVAQVTSLSGGNQQKVAIAAAAVRNPRVLALEEPTRGVDVGSRAEIHARLRAFAAAGNAVVLFCSEPSEVFEVADRALVISNGRVQTTIDVQQHQNARDLAAALSSTTAIRVEGNAT